MGGSSNDPLMSDGLVGGSGNGPLMSYGPSLLWALVVTTRVSHAPQ
jgi:hypothetical protein